MKKILLIIVLTILFCSCKQTSADYENNYIIASSYKVVGSSYCTDVEKFIIEGHEYLVFTSKVANPPTVIHSESCPCHEETQNDTIIIYR